MPRCAFDWAPIARIRRPNSRYPAWRLGDEYETLQPVAFLVWLRESSVCTLIRESESVWGYPTILFTHTLGMSILVGFVVVIDLRLLGVGRTLPIAPLKRLMPLIWIGFWMNAISGTILFAIDGPAKIQNPAFPIKLALIACGIVVARVVERKVLNAADAGSPDVRVRARLTAALSLVLWAGAVTAGRLMAYVGKTG
jgi:hypothetical protein